MTVLRIGKRVHVMTERLLENITLEIRTMIVLSVLFTAVLWIRILPISRIDMLLDLYMACMLSLCAAAKLSEQIFDNWLEYINRKCSGLAEAYDMRMREKRRIEKEKRDRSRGYGKSKDAEVGIEYFIRQEKENVRSNMT